jgi:predicted N-acetyltransferase YhbS
MSAGVSIRQAVPGDRDEVLALLAAALGWERDERHGAFFDWKHTANPYGPSDAWVAVDDDRIVGYRAFLRWEFERSGAVVRAVRAVDTATHPDHRRRGIFEALTRAALEELRADGTEFVFNTPNAESGSGYTKMGWETVGRVPVAFRAASPRALLRVASARGPASRWPESSDSGTAFADIDGDTVTALLAARATPADGVIRTVLRPDVLAWRYANPLLGYRVARTTDDPDAGIVVYRVRNRGRAREVLIALLLTGRQDDRVARALVRQARREGAGDYEIHSASAAERAGGIPAPRQGPLLAWRALQQQDRPPLRDWQLSLGDVELF